jgi:YD repeat-containing protein
MNKITTIRHSRFLSPGRYLMLSLLLLLLIQIAQAQSSVTDGTTPSGLSPGAPAGSYSLSGFENVNLFNGNLNFHLPLIRAGGRGAVNYALPLTIEQHWRAETVGETPPGQSPLYGVNPNPWMGLIPEYGPGVLQARQAGAGNWPYESYCGSSIDAARVWEQTLTRLTFTTSDGTEFELRDQQTGGQPQPVQSLSCQSQGFSRGKVFVTADGSSATFISDATISDYKWKPVSGEGIAEIYPSGYLMLRDGTRYRIDSGLVTWMRDRNGNLLQFSYGGGTRLVEVKDSLNRTITITYDDGVRHYDEISYKGFGGTPRTIRVWHAKLSDNLLRATQSSDVTTTQYYHTLFPTIQGASTQTKYDPEDKVSKVELPDGRLYQFRYNPYGDLARVVLPTGSVIEYDWADCSQTSDSLIYRRVVERRVYKDSNLNSLENKTTYSDPIFGNMITVKVFDASQNLLSFAKHYFFGNAFATLLPNPNGAISYSGWKLGREEKTEELDTNNPANPTVLRRVNNTWQQPVAGSTWPLVQAETSDGAKANNPQITESVVTLVDTNQVAKQTFSYDKYSNQTDVYEYDYDSLNTPVRHSHTDYLTTNSINGAAYDTVNPNATSPNINTTIHLRSLPAQQSIYDGNNAERARITYEYDNYAADTYHTPLVDRPGITGIDSTYTTSYQTRGNATRISRWLLPSGTSINAYARYDIAGNVTSATDGLGNTATTSYTDSFSDGVTRNTYAFSTSTTSPPPDPTGTYGTNTALTSSTVYDFSSGLVTSATDANNKTTYLSYNDPLDRLTTITHPTGGGSTNYFYNDVIGNLYLCADAHLSGRYAVN